MIFKQKNNPHKKEYAFDFCIIGTKERHVIKRNTIIFQGLRELGLETSSIIIPSFFTRTALQKYNNENFLRYHLKFWLKLIPGIFLENITLFAYSLINIKKIYRSKRLYIPSYGNCVVPTVKIFSIIFKKTLILDAHGSLYYQRIVGCEDYPESSIYSRMIFHIDKFTAVMTDKYITLSDTYAETLSKEFGLPRNKFISIYIGNHLNKENPEYEELPCDIDIAQFSSFKLFHGGEDVIRMINHIVKDKKKNISVLFSGSQDSPYLKQYKSLTQRMGLEDNILFARYTTSNKDLFRKIARSKIILGPLGESKLNDIDFSTKMCEALSFGKVLITANSQSAREILEDGKNAILVKPGNIKHIAEKIIELIDDEVQRERIGKNAFETYCKYLKPETLVQKLLDEIEK